MNKEAVYKILQKHNQQMFSELASFYRKDPASVKEVLKEVLAKAKTTRDRDVSLAKHIVKALFSEPCIQDSLFSFEMVELAVQHPLSQDVFILYLNKLVTTQTHSDPFMSETPELLDWCFQHCSVRDQRYVIHRLIETRQIAIDKNQWDRFNNVILDLDRRWYQALTQRGGVNASSAADLLSTLERYVYVWLRKHTPLLETLISYNAYEGAPISWVNCGEIPDGATERGNGVTGTEKPLSTIIAHKAMSLHGRVKSFVNFDDVQSDLIQILKSIHESLSQSNPLTDVLTNIEKLLFLEQACRDDYRKPCSGDSRKPIAVRPLRLDAGDYERLMLSLAYIWELCQPEPQEPVLHAFLEAQKPEGVQKKTVAKSSSLSM